MTKMPGEHKYKNKIWTALACLGILGSAYIFFFIMTITNISKYQASEKIISSLTADISKMEFTFLAKEAEINPSLAAKLGFVEPESIVIAKKTTNQKTVALGGQVK